jgi:uncharacterized protein YdcH (DUF465 family)
MEVFGCMTFVEFTLRAYDSEQNYRLGTAHLRSITPMQLNPDELKAHLMETDADFRTMATQHCEYKRRLETLASRPYLTPEEQVEETRIKKLKLKLKDQMQEVLDRYRHEHVA